MSRPDKEPAVPPTSQCHSIEPRLRALVDGELHPGEARLVLAHLEACATCRHSHARIVAVVQTLQELPLTDAPAHFSPALHVRLEAHRLARARRLRSPHGRLAAFLTRPSSRLRWLGGLAGAVGLGIVPALLLPRPLDAAEIVRRTGLSWRQIRNYGCVFRSEGRYLGQPRVFRQRQFFRPPGEFRLDTSQDYRLTTFVASDRVVHYLPGGAWEGNGPLVLMRSRAPGETGLPFPYGLHRGEDTNVSLDWLVRQVTSTPGVRLVGRERVGGQECYRLACVTAGAAAGQPDEHEVWVDCETFLPRRLRWFRNEDNWIVSEATELQVNYALLPAGTFQFQPPEGATIIRGDVDPHVFALPFHPPRTPDYDTDPAATAAAEAWRRRRDVPFPVLTPSWLPQHFRLVRVRRQTGRWLDVYWLRRDGVSSFGVLKLVEQAADAGVPPGEPVRVGTGRDAPQGWLVRLETPYRHAALTWQKGSTRLTLSGAGLDPETLVRIAESFRAAAPLRAARGGRAVPIGPAAQSAEPVPASAPAGEPTNTPDPPPPPVEPEAPPMLPEMPDDGDGQPEPWEEKGRQGLSCLTPPEPHRSPLPLLASPQPPQSAAGESPSSSRLARPSPPTVRCRMRWTYSRS